MLVSLLYRLPIYGLPLIMYALEAQLDELAKKAVESSFLASAVGSAAIALFLPSMKPSWTSPPGWKASTDRGASAVATAGMLVSVLVWQSLVAEGLGAGPHHWMASFQFWVLSPGASVATILYGLAVFLSEVKAGVEK